MYKAVIILLLSYVTFSMFRLSLGVAIPDIMVELSIDEVRAGLLYSISLWSTAAILTPSGYLADRFERKRILLLGYLLLALGVLGLALSSKYLDSFVSLAMAGIGAGFIVPSYYSMIGEALKSMRGFAIGLAAGVYNFGGLVGSVLVGVFVAIHRWRLAYLVIAVAIISMLALQLFIVRPSEKSIRPKLRLPFLGLLKIRNIIVSTLGIFLGSLAMFSAAAWLPTFFISVLRFEPASAGLLLGLFLLAGAFGAIGLGALSDKIGRRAVTMASGLIAVAISLSLLLTNYTFFIAIVYVFTLGLLLLPYWNLLITIAQESVSKDLVSSVTGLIQTFGLVGSAVGPVLAGILIVNLGLSLALTFTMTLSTLLYGLLAFVLRETR